MLYSVAEMSADIIPFFALSGNIFSLFLSRCLNDAGIFNYEL
jgi:hypothetical protein